MSSWLRKRKKALYWIQNRRRVKGKVTNGDHTCDETNNIDDLPDSLLLVEIFMRLRNPRDVMVCKSVSKRWNSMLSSFNYNPSFALIINTQPPCATDETCLLDQGWKGFDLSNCVDPEFVAPVCVVASYKDVLLCMKYYFSQRKMQTQFYLVNPVTRRWTRVPETNMEWLKFPIGLSGGNEDGRYYIVKLIPTTPSKLTLQLFDSKRGQWKFYSIHIDYPLGWWPTHSQALNFNNALHWLAQDNGPVIAYNPNFRHQCIIIHRSQEMTSRHHHHHGDGAVVSETLTVSMGYLRIIQLVCYPSPSNNHHLTIWTLVDYKQSLWKQEHDSVYFGDMVSDIPWIQDYIRGYNLETTRKHNLSWLMIGFMGIIKPPRGATRRITFPHPLVCHPNNPLLVYLYLPETIVSLDITTKKLRLITKDIKRATGAKPGKYDLGYDMVIPMTLRLDPSLVSDHERVLIPRRKDIV
ncbi:unnamed protein product [Cochlearia groenlandica]